MLHPSPNLGDTQLALYHELAGSEGSIAAAVGACTPPWSCARVGHCGQDRTSVRPTLLHLTSLPSGEGTPRSHTIWSNNTTISRTSIGGVLAKDTPRRGYTVSAGSSPFHPGSRVLRPGVKSRLYSTAAQTLQSQPSVLGYLATVQAVERVQGGPPF